MRYITAITIALVLFNSCDDDDNSISLGLFAEHRGIYIDDFYTGGILGNDVLEDDLLAWIDENDFTDIYLYNIGAALEDGLDASLSAFVSKAHTQNPYVKVSFVSAGFGTSFSNIKEYHYGISEDQKPDGIVSEIEFWNDGMTFFDDFAPWIDSVNNLKLAIPTGEIAPLNADITRQFYIGKIKDADGAPSLEIAKELVTNHDEIFLTNYHTNAWHLSSSMDENSIINKLNLLAQAGMELNKTVNIVILFNVNTDSDSPDIWTYFATSYSDHEFEDAFVEWKSEYNASTAITNKTFLNIKGFGIYRYSDARSARP